MRKKAGDEVSGLADGALPPGAQSGAGCAPIDISDRLDSILAHRRASELAAQTAARKARSAREASERARTTRLRVWFKARSMLRTAVIEVETAILPLGLYLSMADEGAHPVDLAAVEIRLYAFGRPCEMSLDITVDEEGRQVGHDSGGAGPAHRSRLPGITRVTVEDYRVAILAYVERALPIQVETMPCRLCGRRVHEVDGT